MRFSIHTLLATILLAAGTVPDAGADPWAPYKDNSELNEDCRHWERWHYGEEANEIEFEDIVGSHVHSCGAYVRGVMDAFNAMSTYNPDTPHPMCLNAGDIDSIIREYVDRSDKVIAEDNIEWSAMMVLLQVLKKHSDC